MANFKNRTVWIRDNIDVLRGINSDSIDLIYLDPPFNSKANYAAPIGSKAAGAAFKDTWSLSDVDVEWVNLLEAKHKKLHDVICVAMDDSDRSYLAYMAERFLEMHRILKPTGSIYLHCNQDMSHYLKLLMDAIWQRKNFINEIVWNYGTPSGGRSSGKKPVKTHDVLLVYAQQYGKHLYNRQYTPYSDSYIDNWFRHTDVTGRRYRTRSRKGEITRQYLDESPGVPLSTVWSDIMQLSSRRGWFPASKAKTEETGYPTQKPRALLERIIEMGSEENDVILDPFCGCATTMVAAENRFRQWIGIDLSETAVRLVRDRLAGPEYGPLFERRWVVSRSDLPTRSDLGPLPHPSTHKTALYGEQGGNCQGCGQHFLLNNLEVDHIIARARGGTDEIGNLQLLCGHCNKVKGSRGMAYLKAKLQIS